MNAAAQSLAAVSAEPKERAIHLFQQGRWEEALAEMDRVPETSACADAELHNYRARALDALDRHEEALQAVEQALKVNPTRAADLKNKGALLRKLGRVPESLAVFDLILQHSPRDADLHIRRAHVLSELERREDALSSAETAVHLEPANPAALNTRGMMLEKLERYEEALADFERILAIRANDPDALNNRGMVFARWGRFSDALAAYTHSLSIQSDQPQAFYNRSLVRLSLGDWTQGLEEFESRWDAPPLKSVRPRLEAPLWSGQECVNGKTLLLYHEQGYGDTLQCARYLPQLTSLGANVIIAVPAALRGLMETLEGSPRVISLGEPLPPHDFQCPLMSLMRAFGATPSTIPSLAWYLRADPEAVHQRRQRLGSQGKVRIGVAWRGRSYPPINYPRDVPLSALRPLFALNAAFVSLQTELSEPDLTLLRDIRTVDPDSCLGLKDFADTAALIECLDLVICVDTAVAHLAGALGKPVWLMNRYASCWRWGQEGAQSPWYPSMRIFRQRAVGNWQEVVQEVLTAAAQFLADHPCVLDRTGEPGAASTIRTNTLPSRPAALAPREPIRLVCATRYSAEEFVARSPLGRSLPLYRTFPRDQRIELRLFPQNSAGLPSVYNTAIEESRKDAAVLVFIHDDVYLTDYYWTDRLLEGLREFDIVGLAGNRRRVARQASWMYLDDQFQRDHDENLSGVLGHGDGFPELRQLSVYGEPRQPCKLLDGVLLAVRSRTLIERNLRFDPRFAFDFYDLDFCRQAEMRGIQMGTWALSVIHASAGKLGSPSWRAAYQVYMEKYGETNNAEEPCVEVRV